MKRKKSLHKAEESILVSMVSGGWGCQFVLGSVAPGIGDEGSSGSRCWARLHRPVV